MGWMAPLVAALEWTLTVWIPSLLLLGVLKYVAIKKSDRFLALFGDLVSFMIAAMLAFKILVEVSSLAGANDTVSVSSLFNLPSGVIGGSLGLLSVILTDRLASRLSNLAE